MDDLKIRIWDHLFQLGSEQPIDTIAEQLGETPEAIQHAVDDPWFDRKDGMIAIAQT